MNTRRMLPTSHHDCPIAVIIFAVLGAVPGPVLLRRRPKPERSPSMDIAMRPASSFSLPSIVTLAGLALAPPAIPCTTDVVHRKALR